MESAIEVPTLIGSLPGSPVTLIRPAIPCAIWS